MGGVQHGWQPQTRGCSRGRWHPRAAPPTTLPAKATTGEKTPGRVPAPRCESNYSF